MKNLTRFACVLLACGAIASCGDDNKKTPDAPEGPKDAPPDMMEQPQFPAAPMLGNQIDRLGRPAVNTALNGVFADDPAKTTMKDNYNQASDPAMWAMTKLDPAVQTSSIKHVFQGNIAIFDVLDKGDADIMGTPGCGNAVLYNNTGGGTPMGDPNNSYAPLATILADDELYVDTTETSCPFYLALEVEAATAIPHIGCGGRTPQDDVADTSYSLLAAGTSGFDAQFNPHIGDGASAHTDYTATFPYLGAPHTP